MKFDGCETLLFFPDELNLISFGCLELFSGKCTGYILILSENLCKLVSR